MGAPPLWAVLYSKKNYYLIFGYAVREASKLAMLAVGGLTTLLITLEWSGYVTVHWSKLNDDVVQTARFVDKGICGVIVGRAIYTGGVDLDRALQQIEAA